MLIYIPLTVVDIHCWTINFTSSDFSEIISILGLEVTFRTKCPRGLWMIPKENLQVQRNAIKVILQKKMWKRWFFFVQHCYWYQHQALRCTFFPSSSGKGWVGFVNQLISYNLVVFVVVQERIINKLYRLKK